MADWTTNAMLAERNRLAKMLNQRMVRLERAGIDFGAIAQYKEWIQEYYGESKTGLLRFPEKRKAGTAENWNINISLRRELDKLEYFAYQPGLAPDKKWKTQTVGGAHKYVSNMRTRFAAMGLKFPSEDVMLDFLKSESWRTLKKIYSSSVAIRLAGTRQYRQSKKGRASSVEVMDRQLAKFMKRRGDSFDIRNMSSAEIAKVFGLRSQSLLDIMEEDDLP